MICHSQCFLKFYAQYSKTCHTRTLHCTPSSVHGWQGVHVWETSIIHTVHINFSTFSNVFSHSFILSHILLQMCGSHFSLWSLPSLCINWGHLRPISLKVPWHPQKKQLGVHVWEGNFVLRYIFWCPPSTHDKFVHVWGGKWTKFCRCIRFCPRLGGCPRKPVSTYDKCYCITFIW